MGGASKHLKVQAASSVAVASTALAASFLIAYGPLGMVVLGASPTQYTFDCWKPIIRDYSQSPSNGKLLRHVLMDPRIKQVSVNQQSPEIVLENIWIEKFRIDFILLPSGQQAAHASILNLKKFFLNYLFVK